MQDIEQIYTKYAVQVYKYLFSLCHDPHTAEELTQETFFRAMKSIDSFRGDCRLYVWLCQIAKNLWIKEVKQSQRTAVYEPEKEIPSDAMQPDEELIARDERLYLYKRLHQLPEPVREVMYLRISGDFRPCVLEKDSLSKAAWDGKMRWQAMLTSVNGSWSFPIRPSRSETEN